MVALAAGCGSEDGSTDAGTTDQHRAAPSEVRWVDFQGMRIPQATQGPRNPDPVHPSGFERSEVGAALAAINATVRVSVASDDQWAEIVRLNTVSGEGRDWFIQNRIQVSIARTVTSGEAERVVGYRVRAYNEWGANVDIYTETADDSMLVTYTQVEWVPAQQDWGLVLPGPSDPTAENRKATITELPSDAVQLAE
ncbi:hypothetical protein FOS14_19475 [Skermania sp. ID1734]|uniref:hypothetical protein n=1 Tax=Skermania sp. ID1734 TaxID=2597516 RepID=UPI00117D5545|nr:hypothetical protein [Skermania sp. ID1734]TSD94825.1 hypothetical protein FOS14_19475 [Skermania sp. ID1734]